jgi:hypothetical protein
MRIISSTQGSRVGLQICEKQRNSIEGRAERQETAVCDKAGQSFKAAPANFE